ncbi:hypothetical protein HMI56_003914 [Coelomomyces lativittatus]|nr:hypothetical protein HMI56_003914 [Coelomomyces lativittatus]
MWDIGEWVINSNMYIYHKVSDYANDIPLEASAAGTTEVLNSVFISHPKIFK